MTVPESGNNDIMSYQSINLAKGVLSEAASNKDNNDGAAPWVEAAQGRRKERPFVFIFRVDELK